MEQKCKHGRHGKKHIQTQSVEFNFMARAVLHLHKVNDICTARNEEDLHADQVHVKRMDKVHVPRHKHNGVQELGLERHTSLVHVHAPLHDLLVDIL